jgi:hypothetical protein
MTSTGEAEGRRPLVTVGMPVFNAERSVRQALDSIVAQDYANVEVILSDNASTDGTPAICEEYTARDPRVRYTRQPANRGANWNFNHVFEAARGEYFVWAAADDWRGPSFLTTCVKALERDPSAVLCASGAVSVGEWTGSQLQIPAVEVPEATPARRVWRLLQYSRAGVNYCSLIYALLRSSSLRGAMPFQQNWGEDVLVLWRLACAGRFLHAEGAVSYFGRREMRAEEYNAACRATMLDPTVPRSRRFPRLAFGNRLSVGSRGIWALPLGRMARTLLVTALVGAVVTNRETYVEAAYVIARALGIGGRPRVRS